MFSLEAYRLAIGIFNRFVFKVCRFLYTACTSVVLNMSVLLLICLLLLLCGDVELNPGPSIESLLIGHINARSLCDENKFDEISMYITEKNFDLFAISESWLNDNSFVDFLGIPGFHPIFRKDRQQTRGGGVALFASDSLFIKRRSDLEFTDLEVLWVEIKLHEFNLFLGVCYRPPQNTHENTVLFLEYLQLTLEQIQQVPNHLIVLIGDFNAHVDTPFGICFSQWLDCNNLFQIINEPTRITHSSSSILDLIITNAPGLFVQSGTDSPPSNCDHNYIFGKMLVLHHKVKAFKRFVWNFNNYDNDGLLRELKDIDWQMNESADGSIDEIYNNWLNTFNEVIIKFIPRLSITVHPSDKKWMNSQIRLAIRKRNRLLKKYSKRKSDDLWQRYKQQRNLTTSLIRQAKNAYNEKLNRDLSDPSICKKKWWTLVKSLL